jgi:hypothetical protein
MGKNFSCLAAMLFISISLCAQLNDSFSDGNFTGNPAWGGNVADWQVVTSSDVAAGAVNSSTLRLNVATGSGSTYLSTQVTGSWGPAQAWGFFVGRRGQAYTAANHCIIWLWASEANLLSASINGYRIRIGDDAGGDDLVLQKVTNGAVTDILTSTTTLPNAITDAGFLLRVTRSNAGVWELFTSVLPTASGTGAVATDVPNAANASVPQGTVTDNTYTVLDNGYAGFANIFGSGAAARAGQEFDQVQLSFANNSLPVRLENFTAFSFDAGVRLSWDVLEETNVRAYEVQGSNNGSAFIIIGVLKAVNKKHYDFAYSNTSQLQFYRLKIIDVDGSISYSNTISIRIKTAVLFKVIHAGNTVRIEHPALPAKSVFRVVSAEGRLVKEYFILPNAIQTTLNIAALPRGWYCLTVITGGHQRSLSRLFTSLSSL